jgi:alkylation response protein AidB-like acyl-CoA dehydrogenase
VDFRDTADEAAFRAESAAWLDGALTSRPTARGPGAKEHASRWWQEQLAQGGWAGITWPADYGGRGLTIVHEAIFLEESARREAPEPLNLLGMILAGPTILVHGTDEQKQRYLPKMLSGEEIWCQGFSEPGAGSDLASLRTAATPTEGGYVINGQKVWTSFAHEADRCMLLARTSVDPSSKHAGITYFLAPMEGVEVRPLVMINGDRDFNEMFFSDVAVGADTVLGEEGKGWGVAVTTLAFERGSLAFALGAVAHQTLQRLLALAVESGAADDPVVLGELGGFSADVEALRLSTIRQLSELQAGRSPGAEGSAVKLSWARVMQAMTRFAVELRGPDGVTMDDPDVERWALGYLRSRGMSVEGGTDEIQKSILAERVLGLPRSR